MPHIVTLESNGKQFPVETGETVLGAARRAGLALPYSCLSGVCGSCKATVLTGTCHYPHNPPSGLNALELAHHQALLCQAVPLSDLRIAVREVTSVADIPKRVMPLKVVGKVLLAPDVMRLQLATPKADRLRYLPGQYLDVLLAGGKRRAFSIANAPHLSATIELHVRHVSGGGFTSYVFDELPLGAILRVEGPLGTFVPREDSERPMIFMAGGTGFAPIKALIEHFLHLGSRRRIHLYWGARNRAELYLLELPQTWARDVATLRFIPVVSQSSADTGLRAGMVHEAVLQDHPQLGDFDVYMSGPPIMIDTARRAFIAAGLPEDRLYYDSFDYAPDVLAQILRNRAGIQGL